MIAPRLDRRIVRTRALLRDALIALILERGYESITVQQITDRANLARATLYLHYRDKEDLLAKSLEQMFDDLVERIKPIKAETFPTAEPPALIAFQHAQEHADLYRVLLNGQAAGAMIQRVRHYLAAEILRRLKPLAPKGGSPVPLEVAAEAIAGSLLGVMAWWLEHNMPYPPEEMAQMFRQINLGGIPAALGIPIPIPQDQQR